ncbi:hypothetical protein AL550_000010 [Vibrio parahaemolyticus]|nr:hypothetical protein AL550_000010 [Vibrio parahaemolyticus]
MIDGVVVHRGIEDLPLSILVILATETPNKDANSALLYSKMNLEEMNLSALMILNIHKSLIEIKQSKWNMLHFLLKHVMKKLLPNVFIRIVCVILFAYYLA